MAPVSASNKRCLLFMMPISRDWAKSDRKSLSDRKRMSSWVLALMSVEVYRTPRMALEDSAAGRTAEKAEMRLLKVLSEMVPAWPMGMATSPTFPQWS
jgi:hypothetical protein